MATSTSTIFLCGEGRQCLLILKCAQRCAGKEELEAEYGNVEDSLNDTSARGGVDEPNSAPPDESDN
jgi:hypothetical protein